MKVPMKVRLRNSLAPSHETECLNISSRGVYFDSSLPFQVGDIVEVQLRMPEEIAPNSARDWRCHGKIVRVARHDNAAGIGIEFLYYEVLDSTEDHHDSAAQRLSLIREF